MATAGGSTSARCMALVAPHASEGSTGVTYDILIGLPTLLFTVFLASRASRAVRKLKRSQSGIMTTYYLLLWSVCLMNVLRCGFQLLLEDPGHRLGLYNTLWLITRFGMNFLEVSVVIFLAQGYSASGGEALIRTVSWSGVYATLDTIVKIILIYGAHVELFAGGVDEEDATAAERWHKWGYWLFHTGLFTVGYLCVVLLPFTRWRDRLPARPSFYRYVAILLALNFAAFIGAMLLAANVPEGYCVYGGACFLYYALFPPLLWVTFLQEFFVEDDDEYEQAYYAELRESGYFDDDV
mmetsp:Transcript_12567/g.41426  ORF Transcript_12567/g.41426 Transcript_12567/m.41426 type:complete len:296 (-) Transcript_12567:94-981(-)